MRNYNSTKWSAYDQYNTYLFDTKSRKNELAAILENLKSVKLTKTTKSFYTISAKPNWKNSEYKKITLKISVKTGRLVTFKATYAKHTSYYTNTGGEFTVTGGEDTFSNISYGETGLALPAELDGR